MSFPLINVSQYFDTSGAPLAAGTVEFKDPTTNAYINTYPTADDADAQTNANDNPITLNARGEAATGIYLEDGVKYRIILKDSEGAQIWDQDDVLCPIALPYGQTADELAAGITPTNIQYPPGDVKRYGAVGDGATDDTTAIQNAIDASKCVTFPAGTYKLTAKLTITNPRVLNFECGVTLDEDTTSVAIINIDDTTDVTIHGNNALFDHNRSVAGSNIINIRGCERVNIYGVRFQNAAKDGIYVGDSIGTPGNQNTDIVIRDCEFNACRRQGISVVHATRMHISGCNFHDMDGDAPQAGIDLEANPGLDVSHISIVGNKFYDNLSNAGVYVASASHVSITSNHFENNLTGVTIAAVQSNTTEKTISAVDHTTEQWTITGHGLAVGDRLILSTTGGGTIPTGAAVSVVYRVYSVPDANTITLSTYYNAVPLTISDNGTLPLTAYVYSEDETAHITVSGNTFDTPINQGIQGDVATNVVIDGNVFRAGDPGTAVIALNNFDRSIVSNNVIDTPTDGEGIFVSGIYTQVVNNMVLKSPDEGIRYYGGYCSRVDGNTLIDCGEDSTAAGDFRYFNYGSICGNIVEDKSALGVAIGFNMRSTDAINNVIDNNNMYNSASSNANALLNIDRENVIGKNNTLDDGETYSAHLRSNTTNLEDISHEVNTGNKYEGKRIFNSTTNLPVWAVGSAAGDVWVDATGSTDHTPA